MSDKPQLKQNATYHRIIPVRMEMVDEKEGIITGTLTTYGNADSYGDVMDRGCFDEWAAENDSAPMLWSHIAADVIGEWRNFVSDSEGFKATGELVKGIRRADEFLKLYEKDLVTGLSVGFNLRGQNAYDYIYDNEDKWIVGYRFKNLNLREASPVLWPANELAMVTDVKTADGGIDYRALERVIYKSTDLSKRETCAILSSIRASGDPRQTESGDPLTQEQRILRALSNLEWSLKND